MKKRYGLIFDVDGVIADTEEVNARATIRVFADMFGAHGVKREDFEAGLGRGAEEYIKAAARVHGLSLADSQVAAAAAARQANILALFKDCPLQPFPGVLALMHSALARSDFRLAIATSSAREISEAVLLSTGTPYKQMAYVTGNDIKNKKPHPEVFLVAVKRLELTPGDCVVVEDAPNGIAAAHAAGCRCIAVTNSASAGKLREADLILAGLNEIRIQDVIALIDANAD